MSTRKDTNSSAAPSSQESEEWISASPGPDGVMPSSPRLNPSGEQSSLPGFPESPSTPTSATSPSAEAASRGESPDQESLLTPMRESATGIYAIQSPSFEEREQGGVGIRPGDVSYTLTKADVHGVAMTASTSSPSEAPAKTCPSQASGEDSTATAPASSGRPCESPEMALFDPEPYSWKTWKGSSLATVDGTSLSSWTRWPSAGIGGATEFSTRSTSRCHSGESECSCAPSLTTILEPNASPRYSLSAKAAAGILRRATRRGRTLPPALEQALRAVAEAAPSPLNTEKEPGKTSDLGELAS